MNKLILSTLLDMNYIFLYNDVKDKEDIVNYLRDNYGTEDYAFEYLDFEREEEIAKSNLSKKMGSTTPNLPVVFEEDDNKEEDGFLYRNTQFLIDIIIVASFIIIMFMIIYVDIPPLNRDILMILIGGLVKDVASIIGYHRGTSFSSLLKTKAMTKDKK